MRIISAIVAAGVLLVSSSAAFAFGTIHSFGQNAEHERITRHALGCGVVNGPDQCFHAWSLDELAGANGTFGAVGAPDNPANGRLSDAKSHCDNGDYLDVPNYPQSPQKASSAITACRDYMAEKINEAVRDAGPLIKNGKLDDGQIPTILACRFNYTKGRAFCNVIEDFGISLHASQDFYSHSNWTDRADATRPISLENPPGLNNSGPAPYIGLETPVQMPAGLITGCFAGLPPNGTSGCPGRVTHYYLNKDKGTIDPVIGGGTTPRGQINNNFRNAVVAAISDTQLKWRFLQRRLISQYGEKNASLMICALNWGKDYGPNCK